MVVMLVVTTGTNTNQISMSVEHRVRCVVKMLNVSILKEALAASALQDFLEMDTTVQVR